MALFKQVNGKKVKLSAIEETDKRAEWAANDIKKQEKDLVEAGWRRAAELEILIRDSQYKLELNRINKELDGTSLPLEHSTLLTTIQSDIIELQELKKST